MYVCMCMYIYIYIYIYMYVCTLCMYGGRTIWLSVDQPGKVVNLVPGQLNGENECFPVLVRAR